MWPFSPMIRRGVHRPRPRTSRQLHFVPCLEALEDRSLPSLFGPATNYSVGNGPYSVATADLRGDGHLDLVTANTGSNTVSVLLGNGDGTFQSAVNYAVGHYPIFVVVGDFHEDGNLDIVVADENDNALSLLRGNGDGTFQSATSIAVGSGPIGLAVGDFGARGHLDLAVADTFGGNISVLLGNGDGTFQSPVNYATGTFAREIAVGDLTGSGKLDLVVANQGNNTVSVLLGNGDGTFQSPVNYATGSDPTSIALGDFRCNGVLDIVTANFSFGSSTSTVTVLKGNGDGTFQTATNLAVGSYAHNVQVADLDGDGHLDIVAATSGNDSVSVLLGNGDDTFQAAQNFAVGSAPRSVAIGNFDGTGAPSLAVVNYTSNNVSVLLNQSAVPKYVVVSGPSAVLAGESFEITVTVLNQFGGIYNGYLGTVTFTSSDAAPILPDDYTFTADDQGKHVFTGVTLYDTGEQTITVTDTLDPTIMDTFNVTIF